MWTKATGQEEWTEKKDSFAEHTLLRFSDIQLFWLGPIMKNEPESLIAWRVYAMTGASHFSISSRGRLFRRA